MCCRERLRVIVFDKNAILSSERALNCTNIPYFDEVSKCFCMVRSLACPSRIEFLPCCDHRPSDSLQWKTRIACPFWDFFLLGSIHFWLLNVFHLNFRRDRCTRWSPLVTVRCLAMQDQRDYSWMSLNCSEMQEVLGRVRVQAILKPFLWSSSLCQTSYPIVNWPLRSFIELCLDFSIISSKRTAPSSSRRTDGSCRSNLIMAFDTVKQYWRNLSGY